MAAFGEGSPRAVVWGPRQLAISAVRLALAAVLLIPILGEAKTQPTPGRLAAQSGKNPKRLGQRANHVRQQRRARKHVPAPVAKSPKPQQFIIPEGDGSPILSFAARLVGRPYRFGSDRDAYDCSGFVRYVFAKFAVDLPHSARAQFSFGERVQRDELEPGDLVFFGKARRPSHVGIYAGDALFIHAAVKGGRVQVDSLKEAYYARRYLGARRLDI